jgi:hypothetical protein
MLGGWKESSVEAGGAGENCDGTDCESLSDGAPESSLWAMAAFAQNKEITITISSQFMLDFDLAILATLFFV